MQETRVVSYNVHCFPWCQTQIHDIVRWIVANADIVALQEIWCRHAAWKAAFAAHGWVFLHPPREFHITGIFGSGLAVAWRLSDWTLTEARLYPFLPAAGLDSLVSKGWFHVELTSYRKQTPSRLRIINTHMQADHDLCKELWKPIAEAIRMAQATQMADYLRRLPAHVPTLLIGDWNTDICWIHDAQWLSKAVAEPTFPETAQVIDNCATWSAQARHWSLSEHRVFQIPYSDHWAVRWCLSYR